MLAEMARPFLLTNLQSISGTDAFRSDRNGLIYRDTWTLGPASFN